MSDSAWQDLFRTYFETHTFSPALVQFWLYAVQPANGGARVALVSGFCAWEAIRAGLGSAPNLDSAFSAAIYMHQLLPFLGKDGLTATMKYMAESVKGSALDLTRSLAPGGQTRAGMQVCLTLADYANADARGRGQLSELVTLPETVRTFWNSTGVFLFDNGALSPPQLTSLDSVTRSFPSAIHALAAWIVPDAIGIDPAQSGLMAAGPIMALAAIAPGEMTSPSEFLPDTGQPFAPLFTISAAQQMVRAAQAVQFSRRPWLVAYRDRILARAKDRRERYLRRGVLPAVYLDQPDELLPQTAFLWCIDSAAAFRMAYEYARVGERESLDAVLLLADVLSDGGGATLLFHTDPSGIVTSGPSPIHRVPVGDGSPCVNGITVGGSEWLFEVDPTGAVVTRMSPLGGRGF